MRSDQDSIKNSLTAACLPVRQGFTIIELLIAMLISALVLNSAFLFALSTAGAQKRAAVLSNTFQETAASLELMAQEIRASSAISPSSTDIKLVLISGPDLIAYEFQAGKIKRTKNASGQYITSDGSLDSLRFYYPPAGTVSIEIKPSVMRTAISAEAFCRHPL